MIWILERVNLISKQYSTSIKGISNAKFTYRINCLSTHIIANEFCCFFTFHAHQYETLWLWLGDTTYLSYWILVYQGISGLLLFKILILTTICFLAASSSENFSCTKLIHYLHPTVRYSALFSHLQWNFSKGLPITNIYRWAQMKAHLPSVYINNALYHCEKIIY